MSRYVTIRRDANNVPTGKIISTTNERERTLYTYRDLPQNAREDFDYMVDRYPDEQDSPRFVKAYGSWYDTDDTEGLAPDDLRSHGWSTYLTDSFFSGIVFRHFDRDGEQLEGVVVGRFWIEG